MKTVDAVKQWVKTNKGIEVSWNGNKNVKVTVDFHYINKTCGICGVFNNDPTDDLIAGPSSQCLANGTATIAGNLVSGMIILRNFSDKLLSG